MDSPYYTVLETAQFARVSTSTVYRALWANQSAAQSDKRHIGLEHGRVLSEYRITKQAIERWVARGGVSA